MTIMQMNMTDAGESSNPICTNIKKHPTFPNKSAKKMIKKKCLLQME